MPAASAAVLIHSESLRATSDGESRRPDLDRKRACSRPSSARGDRPRARYRSTARWAGSRTRALQTGFVRSYVLALAAGVTILILVFVAVR